VIKATGKKEPWCSPWTYDCFLNFPATRGTNLTDRKGKKRSASLKLFKAAQPLEKNIVIRNSFLYETDDPGPVDEIGYPAAAMPTKTGCDRQFVFFVFLSIPVNIIPGKDKF
jgi:hypothetical protein